MESVEAFTRTFEQAARGAVSAILGSARQIDSVLTSGSLENARSSVEEAVRRRAIQDALEGAWSGGDLSRSA
jgi:hypothetical protein